MRKWLFGLAILSASFFLETCGTQTFYYYCHTGDEINAATQSAVITESLQFMRAAFDGDGQQAFNQMTDGAKKDTDQSQLTTNLQGLKAEGPFENLRVERVMTLNTSGHMQQQTSMADCAKDTNATENNVRVVIANVPEQAYVLVSAKGHLENWLVTLWLVSSSGKWQVQSFQASIATAAGKNVADIVGMARHENEQGHTLNAEILYAAATGLAAHGSFYHTKLEDQIQKEMQEVALPQEFRGSPPYNLASPGGPFKISLFGSNANNGKLYVVISLEAPHWQNSQEIEQKNRSFIKYFASKYPEYQNVFAGLIVEATESGTTNGWRTVMENASLKGKS